MRSRIVLLLALVLASSACRVEDDLCAAYQCAAPVAVLKFKFKDANSQADLIFGPNASHQANKLKVTLPQTAENVPFRIDSTDKHNPVIVVLASSSQNISLKLGDKPEDLVSIETRYRESGCCGDLDIVSLKVNQSTICLNCSTLPPIVLIK